MPMKNAWQVLCRLMFFAAALSFSISNASALCIYNDKLYAKTTLQQEFRDSQLVLHGIVTAEQNKPNTDPNGDDGVLYTIQVEKVFKGIAPAIITNFTERNSGGFYLDQRKGYLLFLNPIPPEDRKAAPNSFVVNYNCGQSREWTKVSPHTRKTLSALADRTKSLLSRP